MGVGGCNLIGDNQFSGPGDVRPPRGLAIRKEVPMTTRNTTRDPATETAVTTETVEEGGEPTPSTAHEMACYADRAFLWEAIGQLRAENQQLRDRLDVIGDTSDAGDGDRTHLSERAHLESTLGTTPLAEDLSVQDCRALLLALAGDVGAYDHLSAGWDGPFLPIVLKAICAELVRLTIKTEDDLDATVRMRRRLRKALGAGAE